MKHNGRRLDYVDLPPGGWSLICDHKIVAPKMLVKGLLPYRGIAFIGGQSGAGKSFVACSLSTSLSSATQFFGRIVKERVGVAIIAAEGTEQTGNRLTAAAQAQGLDIRGLPIAWRGGAPLKSAEDLALIGKQLEELGEHIRQQYGVRLGVAILDTVAATLDMEDEDSNSEVAKAIKKMRDLGDRFGGLVIPIHHYGKTASTGLRGGSAWRAGADVVLSVLCDRNDLTGEISGRELALAKARDGIEGPIAPFELAFAKLGVDEDGEDFGTLIVKPGDGNRPKSAAKPLRNDQKLALVALANCSGIPAPPALQLPMGTIVVDLTKWKDELFARAILDRNASNPRTDFKRLKDALHARSLIGVHDGFVWRVANG
jgi:hypothetical protein